MDRYIHHRLTVSGSLGRPRFTPWALRQIYQASRGIPRIINNLCDKALLAAFIRDSDEVNYWDARRAVKEIKQLTD
jgi:general secretion pathway protein A